MVNTVTVANVVSVNVVTMPAINVTAAGGLTNAELRASAVSVAVTTMPALSISSVSISNFPATQVVSVSNLPASQTIAGTVTASLANVVTNDNYYVAPAVRVMGAGNDGVLLAGIDELGNPVNIYEGGKLPISGTVTANVLAGQYTTITASSVSIGSNSGLIDISNFPNGAILSVEAQPVGGANGVYKIQHIDGFGFGATDISVTNIFTGASAVNISASGTYSFRKNQFNTHLRFTYVSGTGLNASYKILAFSESYWNQTIPISISSVTVGNSVTIGSLPAISGTVTANVLGQHQTDENQRPIPVDSWQTARADTTVDLIVPVQITNDSGTLNASNPLPISGTVTANVGNPTDIIGGGYSDLLNLFQNETIQVLQSGTVVVDKINNSVTIGSLPRVTFIDGSGTVVTANSAVTLFASSSTRSYLLVQVTTGSAFVNVGATATTVNGINLTAGQGYAWETTIPQGLVSLISTTTSSRWVAKEA